MKKIKDERIELQRLKNIRFAFIIQSAGMTAILIWIGVTEGVMALTKSPLWFLFILVVIFLNYQNLKIVDELEDKVTNPGPYYRVILYPGIISTAIGLLVFFFPGDSSANPFLVGGIVFVCFIVPFSIAYFLLKRRYDKR